MCGIIAELLHSPPGTLSSWTRCYRPILSPAVLGDGLFPASEFPRLDPALAEVTPERIAELIDEIKLSADKLAKDRTSRGDVKLLSRTLRELRYAFKVFAPYRTYRKVTIFGSARTLPDQPAYQAGGRVRPADGRASLDGRDRRRGRHHGGRARRSGP